MADERKKKRTAKATRTKAPKRLVQLLSPDTEAARDEGPRLIPLSDKVIASAEDIPQLRSTGYVALADHAMKLWNKKKVS